MVLRVLRPSSIVRRPVSGVVCTEHNSHSIKVIKPLLYTYICHVHTVAPPIILNVLFGQKQFLVSVRNYSNNRVDAGGRAGEEAITQILIV